MPKRKRRALPEVGATFERDYRGKKYRLRVVDKSGETWFEVGGRTFRSPSAAADCEVRPRKHMVIKICVLFATPCDRFP